MVAWTQDGRSIGVETALDDNSTSHEELCNFVLLSINGESEISSPFAYHLELASTNQNISASRVIGQPFDVWFADSDGNKHFINGYVNRFSAGHNITSSRRIYRVQIVPWVWFLSKSSDCRIFQNKTANVIIESIFDEYNNNNNINLNVKYSTTLTNNANYALTSLDYCVQYHETDLAFISRLAKENGLFYYFTFAKGEHTLILSDLASAYTQCTEYEVDQTAGGRIDHWDVNYDFVNPRWAIRDFNYENKSLDAQIIKSTSPELSEKAEKNFDHFEYAGGFSKSDDGAKKINLYLDEEDSSINTVKANSNYQSFFAGGVFKIKTHDYSEEIGKTYVITTISINASEKSYFTGSHNPATFHNHFSAIPSATKFFTEKSYAAPIMHGPQTAIVVGPEHDKVHTDDNGRVRVQFHWDRLGENNEHSSCWLRVSQHWAGKGWGHSALPHIGHEVIVSFLEGNPNSPIITGRVYNGANGAPINAHKNKAKHILKDDFSNQIILDATHDNEQILIECPVKKSKIELGTIKNDDNEVLSNIGVRITSDGDMTKDVKGDVFSTNAGNNYSAEVGTNFSAHGGAEIGISGGLTASLSAGINYSAAFGGNYTYTVGYTNAWTSNAWINATNSDILNVASEDIILGAGDELCFVSNCGGNDNIRPILYANDEKISLSISDEYETKCIGPHNTWYDQSEGDDRWNVGALIASIVAAGSAAGAVECAKAEKTAGTVTLITIASIAYIAAVAIAVRELCVSNLDSAIEPITHEENEENLLFQLHKDDGIKVHAKELPVVISQGDDERYGIVLDSGEIYIGDDDEEVGLTINNQDSPGSIIMSNKNSSSGEIGIYAKEDILLEAGGEVKIKSTSFEAAGNFKVLS